MIGKHTSTRLGAGGGWGLWPVLAMLLAAVAVPAGCVLWFMNVAMRNERLAVRQRLTDVYRQKVQSDQNEIAGFWSFSTHLGHDREAAPEVFEKLVRTGMFSGVVVLDASGQAAYPQLAPPEPATQPAMPAEWEAAARIEFTERDDAKAAEAYGQLAKQAKDASARARALQAQSRCLARAGKKDQALVILTGPLCKPDLAAAVDSLGRLIAPNAQLLALQLLGRDDARFVPLAGRLAEQLNQYKAAALPASQRRFLMESVLDLGGKAADFPTLEAEQLAAEYVQSPHLPPEHLRVTPTGIPGLWQMSHGPRWAVLLFKEDKLLADLKAACRLDEPFVGIRTRLEPPGGREPGREPFLAVPVSEYFPGWQLAVYLEEDPFSVSAAKSESFYLAVGISAIAVITLLAAALASYFGRQIKLTRLKNDFLATVSHELKTPLASMRVLVDTLREGRCKDAQQGGEYLELIARENERLSRLIDNFLTFSRMERNKRAFDFAPLDVAEAIRTAVESVQDRFAPPQAGLTVDLPAELPKVLADRDAMVTVLLNLLDNAWKYSGDRKVVKVRACESDARVCVEVSDNGFGMTRKAMRRIFEKFYQADQTLSRQAGGCGLGLSIVKFILDAHGGTIDVTSQAGKGSTFTVRLPVAQALGAPKRAFQPVDGRQEHGG